MAAPDPQVRDPDLRDPDLSDPDLREVGVLVLGSVNVDHIARVQRLPRAGETLLADSYAVRAGGKGLNQAVAIAKLGARAALVGARGEDTGGDLVRAELTAHGVDITHLVTAPALAATGLALVTVDAQGENSIVVHPGANAFAPRLPSGPLTSGEYKVLLCSLEIPLAVVADATVDARAHGLLTIVNAAPMRGLADDMLRRIMTESDIVIVNEPEACQLVDAPAGDTDELGRLLLRRRVHHRADIVVTLGADGALLTGPAGLHRVPAPVVAATNTVGAGDTFAGMLAVAVGAGRPLAEAATLACAAGAIAVSRPEQLSLQAVGDLLDQAQ